MYSLLPYNTYKQTYLYEKLNFVPLTHSNTKLPKLYNISNKGDIFGSEIVSEEVNNLAQSNYTNKNTYTTDKVFKKQGAISNVLFIDGFKKFGDKNLEWMDSYNLQINRKNGTADAVINNRGRY
jgi:hypothetical protein